MIIVSRGNCSDDSEGSDYSKIQIKSDGKEDWVKLKALMCVETGKELENHEAIGKARKMLQNQVNG